MRLTINIVKDVSQSNDNILSALTQYSEIIRSNRADLVQTQGAVTTSANAGSTAGEAQDEALNLDMLNS